MKMKKLIALALSLTLVMGNAAGCGKSSQEQPSGSDNSQPAASDITLKHNFVKGATDPQHQYYTDFWNDVEKASNGTLKGEIYVSESLGTTADVMEQAAAGEAVVVESDLSYIANYVPDFGAIQAPYLIQEPEQIKQLWASDIFQQLCAQLEEKGLHLIALNYEGSRNLITKKPITSRDDVAGLKLRCASTPLWTAIIDILGGNPTGIAMSEAYQALSQGVADGAECVNNTIYSNKWYEVCKYITETEHLVNFVAISMSSQVYESLSPEQKEALDTTADIYMDKFLETSGAMQDEYQAKLEAEGVVFSEIDKTPFIEAASKITDYFPEWTPGILDDLKAVLYN